MIGRPLKMGSICPSPRIDFYIFQGEMRVLIYVALMEKIRGFQYFFQPTY